LEHDSEFNGPHRNILFFLQFWLKTLNRPVPLKCDREQPAVGQTAPAPGRPIINSMIGVVLVATVHQKEYGCPSWRIGRPGACPGRRGAARRDRTRAFETAGANNAAWPTLTKMAGRTAAKTCSGHDLPLLTGKKTGFSRVDISIRQWLPEAVLAAEMAFFPVMGVIIGVFRSRSLLVICPPLSRVVHDAAFLGAPTACCGNLTQM
jgi:hypothetical protein